MFVFLRVAKNIELLSTVSLHRRQYPIVISLLFPLKIHVFHSTLTQNTVHTNVVRK